MADSSIITLYPKKSTALWLLLICSLFVAAGIWIAPSKGWMGYLIAAFFGLGIPVAIVQLLPSSAYLQLNDESIAFCCLFRKTSIPWEVIDDFFVVTMRQSGLTIHEMVGFNYVQSYDRTRVGRALAKAISKCEGALPDTYGMRAAELAELLNARLLSRRHAGR